MLRQELNGADSSSFKNINTITDTKSISATTISMNIGKLDNPNQAKRKARVQSAPATQSISGHGFIVKFL
jgi:hypothetical protein